jgi:multidrug efflux system outer membrane protein
VKRLACAVLVVAALAGCTVGPNFVRPTVMPPAAWRIEYPQAADVANTQWWAQFGDPVLDQLVDTAVRENLDIRIAAARVDQFIGQLVVTQSQFYPQLGYGGGVSRNRSSTVGATPIPPGVSPYFTLYQASVGANWQVDLFGRVRRLSESAQAQVYASEQGRRGVVLSVAGNVASAYIALRGLDRQLEIARYTAANYADTLRIFELRYKGGVVSQVELEQVRSQNEQALAAIPAIEQRIAAQENLISLLLGRDSGPIPRGKAIDQLVAPAIPADLPSSLLERRPDIVQAEDLIVAANANIGAAKALYFPQLSLTGTLGSVSAAFGNFLGAGSAAWQVAAGLTGPIFTFGSIGGQVLTAEAQTREAIANYQRTILNAFRETNDALVGTQKRRQEAEAQARRVAALREYARLSRRKFDNGYAGFLEVLYAENELFSAELAAVDSRVQSYTQIVDVYTAMGGGWVNDASQMAPQPFLADRAQGIWPLPQWDLRPR